MFIAKAAHAHGRVAEGTSVADCLPDEIAHKNTIHAKPLYCRWDDHQIYLLDTPGALVTAIRAGAITTALAETLRARLRENRFEMDPRPFDELVKEE